MRGTCEKKDSSSFKIGQPIMLFPLRIMIDHIIDGDIDGNTDGDDHGKKAHNVVPTGDNDNVDNDNDNDGDNDNDNDNVVPTGESEILMATMMQGMPISYTLCSINDH